MNVAAKCCAKSAAISAAIRVDIGSNVNQEPPPDDLPESYWQENNTQNWFIEEDTSNVLTLEDL